MNDLVKQLAEQAQIQMVSEARLQEFAELIVEECTKVMLTWKSEPFPFDPEFASRLLLEHFNIKSKWYKNIKAGSDIHSGDGGYQLGTQEAYEEFVKQRNRSA